MMLALLASSEIGDPENTRTVYAVVALLVVLGIALLMLAFWMWRVTRPDPELLAPLELMGERSWRRGDPVWQRRRLDDVRPTRADPLSRPIAPPDPDESFDAGPRAFGFSDLRDVAVPGEPGSAQPAESDQVDESPVGAPVATFRPVVDDVDESGLDPEAMAPAEPQLDDQLGPEGSDRPG